MTIITWFLVTLSLFIDPLYCQYTVTSQAQSALTPGIYVLPFIFKPLKETWLSRSRYVDITLYLNSFSKFETYVQNATNDLNSSDAIDNLSEAHTTFIMWGN